MRSMTGFGTGRATDGPRVFVLEIRSVNHRYCDVRVHLPPDFGGLESHVEREIRRHVDRGRLEVSLEVSYAEGAAAAPRIDLARARGYRDALELLARELGLEDRPTLALVAAAPGVIRGPAVVEDPESVMGHLDRALAAAIGDLTAMREREGQALFAELSARAEGARALVAAIGALVPKAAAERKHRLEQRLAELLGERELDPGRVAQEVAVLADRADVTEELTRLGSHLAQLERLLAAAEPAGRKLDFLLQEMHREVNTIGSKTSNAEISHRVVELKAELERMREQVQNVE